MRIPGASTGCSTPGSHRIREQFGVPAGFPPEVALAAIEAVPPRARDRSTSTAPTGRSSRSTRRRSTDLDQAFAIERAGDDIVLHYAIADVGFFVRPGDAARRRGVAARRHGLPARRAGAAVPGRAVGGRRQPAARRAPPGRGVHRARRPRRRRRGSTAPSGRVVRSRAKLAYDTRRRRRPAGRTSPSWPGASRPPRSGAGAPRVEFPEQELDRASTAAGSCASRPGCASEEHNAGDVAGHQPGRRRRAARRRHRAVPGDARARRAAPSGGSATRRGRSASTGRRRSRSPSSSARCRRRPARRGVPARRAAGQRRRQLRAVRAGRDAVARGDGGDVRPRHRAAAPPGRSLRHRGGARRRQRPTRARRRRRRRSPRCPAAMARGESLANRVDARGHRPRRGRRAGRPRRRGVRRRRHRRGPPRHA